jgi:ketosteroid isomerase-like protein
MEASSDIRERNIELTRRGFEAYNSGDYEAVIALLHPDVELRADHELLNSGSFTGHDGFMQWSAEWLEAWEEFSVDANAVEMIGDHFILVDSHQVARGAGSGIDVEMDVFWALEAEAGKLRRMHIYATRERALDAIRGWGEEREPPADGDT